MDKMTTIDPDWLDKIIEGLVFENPDATIRDYWEIKEELEGILNNN